MANNSDQQPYTPTWDKVREHYYLGRQQFDDPMYPAGSVTEIVAEFDRWHAAEIAAAEQRGAIKALRNAAKDITEGYDPETDMRVFDAWDVSEILTAFAK